VAGDTALIGAFGDDDNGNLSGSAYVFTRTNGMWVEQAKLTASDGNATDSFGSGVALAGDSALIGAYFDDDKGDDSGSAYLFDLDLDDDGLFNSSEVTNGTDPSDPDTDDDNLEDGEDQAAGTDPFDPDTDDDGANDGEDAFPLDDNETTDTDSDGTGNNADDDDDDDGMPDSFEIDNGFDQVNSDDAAQDADGDGISNLREFKAGTDPLDADSFPSGLIPWLRLLLGQ